VNWKVDPALKLWDRYVQGISNIARLLRTKGAGSTCWVISDYGEIDGKALPLESALEAVVGTSRSAILSCIPGRLAYFEDEHEALLLVRKRTLDYW
jgi:hypothetical protein